MELFKTGVLALWLHEHPGTKVLTDNGKTYYWYDKTTNKFYYQCPENKKLNKIYEARGLSLWYKQSIETLQQGEKI